MLDVVGHHRQGRAAQVDAAGGVAQRRELGRPARLSPGAARRRRDLRRVRGRRRASARRRQRTSVTTPAVLGGEDCNLPARWIFRQRPCGSRHAIATYVWQSSRFSGTRSGVAHVRESTGHGGPGRRRRAAAAFGRGTRRLPGHGPAQPAAVGGGGAGLTRWSPSAGRTARGGPSATARRRRRPTRIGQALLELGLGQARPLLLLSGNGVDHLLMTLGALTAGIPVAPVSVAYSLQSKDHARIRAIAALIAPGRGLRRRRRRVRRGARRAPSGACPRSSAAGIRPGRRHRSPSCSPRRPAPAVRGAFDTLTPGRDREGPVHLRLHRGAQGRAQHAPDAVRPTSR